MANDHDLNQQTICRHHNPTLFTSIASKSRYTSAGILTIPSTHTFTTIQTWVLYSQADIYGCKIDGKSHSKTFTLFSSLTTYPQSWLVSIWVKSQKAGIPSSKKSTAWYAQKHTKHNNTASKLIQTRLGDNQIWRQIQNPCCLPDSIS